MQIKDLFDDMPLPEGAVVDIRLQKLLREPLDVCADWQRTENLLLEAHRLMPQQLEVLVALYKMYAYSNRFDESLQRIEQVLTLSAGLAGFPAGLSLFEGYWNRFTESCPGGDALSPSNRRPLSMGSGVTGMRLGIADGLLVH